MLAMTTELTMPTSQSSRSAQPDAPFRTYNELIADWIEAGVTEAEQRLNDGRPLPPTPAGQIPRGRPPVQFN